MNSFERERDGKGILADREILQKDSIFWWNAKCLGIKAVAAVVLLPCAIELVLAVPMEVMPKNLGSFAVAVECAEKELTDIEFRRGRIVERGEFVSERLTEGSACSGKAVSPVSIENNQPTNKAGYQSRGPSGDNVSHFDWWAFVGSLVALGIIYGGSMLIEET